MASTIVNFESHTATMQQNIDGILASVDNLTRVKELVETYRLVRKVMIFLIIAAAFILISMILGASIGWLGILAGLAFGIVCVKMKGGVMTAITAVVASIVYMTALRDVTVAFFIPLGLLLISAIVFLVKQNVLKKLAGRIQP